MMLFLIYKNVLAASFMYIFYYQYNFVSHQNKQGILYFMLNLILAN